MIMSLENLLKLAVGSVLLFFILTAVVSIFAVAVMMVFSVVFFIAVIGFASTLMTGITSKSDSKEKETEAESNSTKETMTQQERVDTLKRKYLEGEITEEQFEQLLDKELNRQKEKEKEFNRQNIF